MKKIVTLVLLFAVLFGLSNQVQAQKNELKGQISLSGAFALYPLAVKWAEEFKKLHPGVKIDVSGGGAGKGITDIDDLLPDRTITIQYIPKEHLLDIQDNLKAGDIVSIIMDQPGIFSAHMGFIMKDGKKTIFRHASQSAMNTIDQPFEEIVAGLIKNPKRLGMSFMRIREDVQWDMDTKPQHGKIRLSDLK